LHYCIVLKVCVRPLCGNSGIAADAELSHEGLRVANHAKKANVVVKAVLDEIVEAIGTQRRPCAMDFNRKVALTCRKQNAVGCRRGLFHFRALRVEKSGVFRRRTSRNEEQNEDDFPTKHHATSPSPGYSDSSAMAVSLP